MKRLLAFMFVVTLASAAFAQSTALTYQGRLSDNGIAASGTYDFQFMLRDAATNQIGPTFAQPGTLVSVGTFSATLDFGAGVFTGAPRWLEIGVRTNGSAAPYATLLPRQPITATPYAMQALVASNVLGGITDSQLSANIPRLNGNQQFNGAITFNPQFGTPFAIGSTNTNRVVWLNADLLDGLDSSVFARSNHTHSALDITSGTLSDARLSANVALLNDHQNFVGSNSFAGVLTATNGSNTIAGTFSGSGAGLNGLNAANLAGVIPNSALPASVARLGSNQTFTGAVTFSPVTGAPLQVGSATLVTNLNADLLDGVSASAFWNLGGNAGTTGVNFIGTTDNQPLELRVNNSRALRIVPTVSAANIVAGALNNSVGVNVLGGVVGGGSANTVTGNFAVVIGGQGNSATNFAASVLGGAGNIAGGQYSVAAGRSARATHDGALVWADGSSATVFTSTAPNTVVFRAVGGIGIGTNAPATALHVAGTVQSDNLKLTAGASAGAVLVSDASGNGSWQPAAMRAQTNVNSPNLIGGHVANTIAGGIVGATIGGGGSPTASNYVNGNYGTIAGGAGNRVTGVAGAVGGGTNNVATNYATVSGGWQNSATGENATVGGGTGNTAAGFSAVVAGGSGNSATNLESAVVGGFANRAGGQRSFVGGGTANFADGTRSTIAGGDNNRATNSFSAIGGGIANTNYGSAATIGGGQNNAATNLAATIPGGSGNVAGGQYSFAAGRNARALHDGAFVWSDASSSAAFSSSGANQFMIRAAGGVGINGAPFDAVLDIEGDTRVNDNEVFLRASNDRNHGLGWYGPVPFKPFAGFTPDGPVLYGWSGGVLGSIGGGQKIALTWDANQRVAIGGTATLSNPLTVEGAGTDVGGGAGFPEVVARFKNTLAQQSAIAIDAGVGRESALFLSQNGAPWWSVRNNGSTHNLQFHYNGGGSANSVVAAFTPSGLFGIGTAAPTEIFHVSSPYQTAGLFQNAHTGGTWLGLENNGGGRRWSFISTGTGNGEGAGQLLFYAGGARVTFRDNGNVGIGTTLPGDRLEVEGPDATVRIQNSADNGLGAFLENTYSTLQLGMFSETTAVDKVPAGGKRSFFGLHPNGSVGSLNNNAGSPVWRNFLDDGNGNMFVNTSGSINFGNQTRQMLNLWATSYGIGVQNNTMYHRTDGNFAWYRFGSHVDTELSSGGGSELMRLNSSGLVVQGTVTSSSDRNVKADFAPVNPAEILARVLALPIQTWRYTNDENRARHLGPMSQDFYAAFNVGSDDKHIAAVDADGVALAAIQGLDQLLREKDARIGELEKRIALLEKQAAAQQRLDAQWQTRVEVIEEFISSRRQNRPIGNGNTPSTARVD